MEKNNFRLTFLVFVASLFAITQAFPVDYDIIEVPRGNSINNQENSSIFLKASSNDHDYNREYGEIFKSSNKRNIISALQAKIRRSKALDDVEDKLKFNPVLSVDALGNLNGFFGNLANNIHIMESKNLLPNQMRLLGDNDNRFRDPIGHSIAFINTIRAYKSPQPIRKLMDKMPDTHQNSNFYDPVLTRIGLGK
ncbi:CLUMA_CG006271, isoform A, partial [Clunio marinus]